MGRAIFLIAQADQDAATAIVAIVGFACLGIIGLIVYFIPSAVAVVTGHRNGCAIFMLNLLLGWTFIGWVVALVWACAH